MLVPPFLFCRHIQYGAFDLFKAMYQKQESIIAHGQ